MGTCDLSDKKKDEVGQVEFDELNDTSRVKLSRQAGPNDKEAVENGDKQEIDYNDSKQLTFNNFNAFIENVPEVPTDNPESLCNQLENEPDNIDTKNTSLEEAEQTVQPTIINKKKMDNHKVEHPLKRKLLPALKGILRNQIG